MTIDKLIKSLKDVGITVTTPQFDRANNQMVLFFPKNEQDLDKLKTLDDESLRGLGLAEWEAGHWLFPYEWYDYIPNGYNVVDINGEIEPFVHGKTDDDKRYGCLAYGFIKD